MQATSLLLAGEWEPDFWYVTDGDHLVGPVGTDLLLRGISCGRVPEDCYVAQPRWQKWRTLDEVREVRALKRQRKAPGSPLPLSDIVGRPDIKAATFAGATNRDEVFRQALSVAVRSTNASVGLVHRDLPPHFGLVTTHSYGIGMQAALGHIVPWYDEARGEGLWDRAVLGSPEQDAWARASAGRMYLGHTPIKGVALLPVYEGRGPRTLIELGHFQHGFRKADTATLRNLAEVIALRLDQLAF